MRACFCVCVHDLCTIYLLVSVCVRARVATTEGSGHKTQNPRATHKCGRTRCSTHSLAPPPPPRWQDDPAVKSTRFTRARTQSKHRATPNIKKSSTGQVDTRRTTWHAASAPPLRPQGSIQSVFGSEKWAGQRWACDLAKSLSTRSSRPLSLRFKMFVIVALPTHTHSPDTAWEFKLMPYELMCDSLALSAPAGNNINPITRLEPGLCERLNDSALVELPRLWATSFGVTGWHRHFGNDVVRHGWAHIISCLIMCAAAQPAGRRNLCQTTGR